MTKTKPIPKVLTVKGSAALSGLHQRMIYRKCQTGEIAHLRIGKTIYIKEDELIAFMEKNICDVRRLARLVASA